MFGDRQDWRGMRQAWRSTEMHTGFGLENLKEKDSLEDLSVNGRTILKWILNMMGWKGLDLSGLG